MLSTIYSVYRFPPDDMAVSCDVKAPSASLWRLVRAWSRGTFDRIGVRRLRLKALQQWPHAPRQLRTEWAVCKYAIQHLHVSGRTGEHLAGVQLDRFRQCEDAEIDWAFAKQRTFS